MEQERTGALDRAVETYKGWPRWGRIGAPVAVALLGIGILGGGEDEEPVAASADVAETTTTEAEAELASDLYDAMPAGIDRDDMEAVVDVACDSLGDDDTDTAAVATFAAIESSMGELDGDAFADTTGALADIAPLACPDEVADHPDFLNALTALRVERTETTFAPTTVAPTTTPPTTAAPTTTAPPPPPPTTAAPPPPPPPPTAAPAPSASYANCTEARAAGAAPVYRGDPGYGTHLDRDQDGVGCE